MPTVGSDPSKRASVRAASAATVRASVRAASAASVTAGVCWLAAGVAYLLAEAVTASAFPGYSYALNYISDLGIPDVEVLAGRPIDSPLHGVMTAGFVLHGVLFALGAIILGLSARWPLRRTFVALAVIHACGMGLIAVVPGGQASIAAGLGWVHLLGAGLALFGGQGAAVVAGIALLRGQGRAPARGGAQLPGHRSIRLGVVGIVLGVIGFLGIVMLEIDVRAVPGTILPDGVWERIGFYAVIAWDVVMGAALLKGAARSRGSAPTARRPDPRGIGAP